MQWFVNWWDSLGGFGQALACAAIPSSILLLLQTLMLLFGGGLGHPMDHGDTSTFDGAHDHGFDATGHGHDFNAGHGMVGHGIDQQVDQHDMSHAGEGLRLFTVRGIIAFFAVGGWTGLVVWDTSQSELLSIISALVVGSAALVFAALVIRWALNMQDSGNLNLSNAISKTATVYIPIPAGRVATGRVMMLLQERYVELEAVTDSSEELPTGGTVQVVGLTAGGTLVVTPNVGRSEAYV